MINGKPTSAVTGESAFDVNQPLSGAQAAEFVKHGFTACIRYIPRTASLLAGNITTDEANAIIGAGLSLGFVQHVALPGWQPTAALGTSYGDFAATYAKGIGVPEGVHIFLDLEEVASGSTTDDVISYCKAWYNEVKNGGYIPAIYCGWNIKLSADQLYYKLPFALYWAAYNFDEGVSVRGCAIRQKTQQTLNGITYDPNEIQADQLGGLPIFLSE